MFPSGNESCGLLLLFFFSSPLNPHYNFVPVILRLVSWFSNLRVHQNPLEDPTIRVSDPVDLGWGLRICIFLTSFQMLILMLLVCDHTLRTTGLTNPSQPSKPSPHVPSPGLQTLLVFLDHYGQLLLSPQFYT